MATFRVARVGSDGLNVRAAPGLTAAVIGSLDEGTVVQTEGSVTTASGRDWRHIMSPRDGFVADSFLDAVNGGSSGGARKFRVARVGSDGLNVRSAPGLTASVIGNLDEGTVVDGEDGTVRASGRDWRHILHPRSGFVADSFLDLAGDDEQIDHDAIGSTRRGELPVTELFTLVRRHGAGSGLDRIMVAAALAESGGDTEAVGDNGHSIGLWQMHDQGLGSGMSREARHDPDNACRNMLREFRRVHSGAISDGLQGRTLAVHTYVFTERPAGTPSLSSPAALKFLSRFDEIG